MKKYIQISIPLTGAATADCLVAEMDLLGYTGFEEQENSLQAWIQDEDFADDELNNLLHKYGLNYSKSIIDDQNWNAVWESAFDPVIVEDFVGIRAEFHQPLSGVQQELLITPKMSFGTGHHATTWLMILLMRELDWAGKKVLDFGTGTGILAILAEKLGASRVLAVDNDPWSVENAAENIVHNHCQLTDIQLVDNIYGLNDFDCLLANINRHILLANLNDMSAAIRPGGHILLSGILETDIPDIQEAAERQGWQHQKTGTRPGWAAQLYQLPVPL